MFVSFPLDEFLADWNIKEKLLLDNLRGKLEIIVLLKVKMVLYPKITSYICSHVNCN